MVFGTTMTSATFHQLGPKLNEALSVAQVLGLPLTEVLFIIFQEMRSYPEAALLFNFLITSMTSTSHF